MKKIISSFIMLFVLINSYTIVSASIINYNPNEMNYNVHLPNTQLLNDHIDPQISYQGNSIIEQPSNIVQMDDDIINLISQINVSLVTGFIQDLVDIGPRKTATDACEQAGRYIYQQFESMGLDVKYKNWSSSSTLYGSNIEATLQGADKQDDDIYIVCGHYDTVQPSPGADDNGAGTAAVLACAYVMSQYSFNHTLRFVTFSGEEQGLHGSYHYASEAYELNEPILRCKMQI